MYSRAIEEAFKILDKQIKELGVPKEVHLVDSQANREFVQIAKLMEKYKDINFVITNSETAQYAQRMRVEGHI